MSGIAPECVVYQASELIPDAWKSAAGEGPVRTFNPGLLRDGQGWLFAYRLVAAEGLRRIAICRLDEQLRAIAGSPRPLTDHVRFRADVAYPEVATRWFADPRLYRLHGRLFVYWNSGWHEPRNYQFLQELDPTSLLPLGAPRELVLKGERQKLEKNWTLFCTGQERGGEFHVVYSITPHRVLTGSLSGSGDIVCEEVARQEWSLAPYPASHGGLRGGTPPVLDGGRFWSVAHSVHGVESPEGYSYAAGAYAFDSTPPFAPCFGPIAPLALGADLARARLYPRLNPAVGTVIYPCGAARDGARWLISHGINDERCAISRLAHTELQASVHSLASA